MIGEVLTMKTVKDYWYIIVGCAVANRVYTKWRRGVHSVAVDMCHIASDMLFGGEY